MTTNTNPRCEVCDTELERAAGPGEWSCPNAKCNAEGVVVYVTAPHPEADS